jgi:hypothetical protein
MRYDENFQPLDLSLVKSKFPDYDFSKKTFYPILFQYKSADSFD